MTKNKIVQLLSMFTIIFLLPPFVVHGQQTPYSVSAPLVRQAPFKSNFKRKKSISIAYLPPATEYNFYLELGKALQTEAQKNHSDFQMKAPQNGQDWQQHVAMIDEMVKKGVDVIVFSSFLPQTENALIPIIKQAVEQGIIVINVNGDNVNLGYPVHAVVGVKQRKSTHALAQHALSQIKIRPAKVAILAGEPGQFSDERVGGIVDGLQNTGIQIVANVNGHWNSEGGYAATLNILNKNPEVVAIFAANDFEIMGAASALKILGREDVLLYGYDGAEDALELIALKELTATSLVNAQLQGITVYSVLLDILNAQFSGGFVEVPTEVVNQKNALSFLSEIQKLSLDVKINEFTLTTEIPEDALVSNKNSLAQDVFKEIYEPLGIKIKLEFVPYKRAVHMVTNNLADAMLNNFRGQDAGSIIIPQWHYGIQQISALFKKNTLEWQGTHSLKDKKVVWIRGFGFERYIQVDTIHIENTYRSSALEMLAKDRIDVFIDDKTEIIKANELLQSKLDLNQYQLIHITTLKRYPAFAKSAKGHKLARIYDQRLPVLLHSGKLKELYQKWDYPSFPYTE